MIFFWLLPLPARPVCNTCCSVPGPTCQCMSLRNMFQSIGCQLCQQRCTTCNSLAGCTSCEPNYYLAGSLCRPCQPFCQQCNGSSGCSSCWAGYFFDSSTGVCSTCLIANALTCSTATLVTTCVSSYYLNGNACLACRPNCLSCIDNISCSVCLVGFVIMTGAGQYCFICPDRCTACSSITPTSCTACLVGYALSSELHCLAIASCTSGCLTCLSASACYVCSSGFFLTRSAACQASSLLPSLLCDQISYGNRYYQCGSCTSAAYNPASNPFLCLPRYGSRTLTVLYLHHDAETNAALYSAAAQSATCGDYSVNFIPPSSSGSVSITLDLGNFYGVAYRAKVFVNQNLASGATFTLRMVDANSQTDTGSVTASVLTACSELLISGTTQSVSASSLTLTLSASVSGLSFGLSELFLAVSVCGQNCIFCANNIYCYVCTPPYVLVNNQCTTSCGNLFIQVSGLYTSCLPSCSDQYFPSTASQRRCLPCQSPCFTCLSSTTCLSCVSGQGFYYNDLTNKCLGPDAACSNGFFKDSTTFTCAKCITPCLTCSSSTACQSCSIGFYNPSTSSCVGQCPSPLFANSVTASCSSCAPSCATCISRADNCLSCNTGSLPLLLNNQCLASCPDGYYPGTASGARACLACDSSCSTCVGATGDDCTSCLFNNLNIRTSATQSGRCVATCPTYYFAENQLCKPCALPCNTCASRSICLDCSPIAANTVQVFFQGSCIAPSSCATGYFVSRSTVTLSYISNGDPLTGTVQSGSVQVSSCLPCVSPCRACTSTTACVTCVIGFLSGSSCTTLCPSGTFGQSSSGICKACPVACSLCSSDTLCSSCAQGFSLQVTSCLQSCDRGFYSSSGVCQQCPSSCTSCSSAVSCSGCQQGFFLSVASCVLTCPLTFFGSSLLCQQCAPNCEICISSTSCTRCASGSFLSGITCVSSSNCPNGFYPDSTSRVCTACVAPCRNCLNSRTCTSCTPGLFLTTSGTCEGCPSGSFVATNEAEVQVCLGCSVECATCTALDSCTSCQANFFLFESSCVTQSVCLTKTGSYPNTQQWRCASCVTPCRTCTGQSTCLTCATGFLYQTSCLTSCLSTYYADSTTSTCKQCNRVTPASNCLDCFQNAGTESCLSCQPKFVLLKTTCINDCPSGNYIDPNIPGVCQACAAPCATCQSISSCLTCTFGILLNNQCLATCPVGYYGTLNNAIKVCAQCNPSCAQCGGSAGRCTSCPLGFFLKSESCVSAEGCGDLYFADSRSQMCLNCLTPCALCSSLTFCITCANPNSVIFNGVCLSSCPDGQFISQIANVPSCIQCHVSCATCYNSQQNGCLSCTNPALSLLEGVCLICPSTMYSSPISKTCVACNPPCATCTSISDCLTCTSPNQLLVLTQCLVLSACPAGTYLQSLTARSCQSSCDGESLADPTSNRCVASCPEDYARFNRTCVEKCPSDFYLTMERTCLRCQNTLGQVVAACLTPLTFKLEVKTFFNKLLLYVRFSAPLLPVNLTASNFRVRLYPYLSQSNVNRLLVEQFPVEVLFQDSQNVHLRLKTNDSLDLQQVELWLLGRMGRLQGVNGAAVQNYKATGQIERFDQYGGVGEQGVGIYSRVMSLVLVAMLAINVLFNSVYLAYPMLDFYQLLYLLLFVNLEYPPNLNYFCQGFKFAHYLFLPQLFSFPLPLQQGPGRFSTLTPDVNFLRNTGHAFLLIFLVAGALLFAFLASLVLQHLVRQEGEEALELRNSKIPAVQRLVSSILARFRFNYINDVLYVCFSYLSLFCLAQYLDFPGTTGYHYASCFFAITVLLLLVLLPLYLFGVLYSQLDHILEQQPFPSLKFALAGIDRSNTFGLALRLLQYPRKLLGALVLVVGYSNPLYFYGWTAVTSALFAVLILSYRPYLWRLQNYFYILVELCQTAMVILLSVLGLAYNFLGLEAKQRIGWGVIALAIGFTLLLLIYNFLILGAEVVLYFTGVNYLEGWTSAKVADASVDDSNSETSKKDTPLQSNILIAYSKHEGVDAAEEQNSDQDYNPFLQEGEGAPRILMKCMKTVGAAEEDLSEDSNHMSLHSD